MGVHLHVLALLKQLPQFYPIFEGRLFMHFPPVGGGAYSCTFPSLRSLSNLIIFPSSDAVVRCSCRGEFVIHDVSVGPASEVRTHVQSFEIIILQQYVCVIF